MNRAYPAIVLLFATSLTVTAEPGRPDDFRPLIEQAIAEGRAEVTIPPGVYQLKNMQDKINIERAKNLTIIADGVTIVGNKLTQALAISGCENVTLRGLTLDYDPLPFTQGTVTAVTEQYTDITLHDGYPRKAYSRIDLCDPKTRYRKDGMPFMWGSKAEFIPPNIVRVTGIGKAASVGDLASLSGGPDGAPHGITIVNCANLTLDHVTVYTAPGMGIIESDGFGKTRMTHCRVIPGPPPAGATEERLLSTPWDAIQSKTVRHGPLVENCTIRDAGDDSWSIQSSDFLILKQEGRVVTVGFWDEYDPGPQPGDTVSTGGAYRAEHGKTLTVTVEKSEILPNLDAAQLDPKIHELVKNAKPWTRYRVGQRLARWTLAADSPFREGDSVYCPDRQGNGYVFRNNDIRSSGRVLLKAGNGLIENNRIDHAHAGVTIAPEIAWRGAAQLDNIVIRGNTFTRTNRFCPAPWSTQAGCVSISDGGFDGANKFSSAGIFTNILIENNIFDDISAAQIVITSARDVIIRNNQFRRPLQESPNNTGQSYGINNRALIWLGGDDNVSVENNQIIDAGKFLEKELDGNTPVK